MLDSIDYQLIDADNHYYEPADAFSRHIEAKFADDALHVVGDGQRAAWVWRDRKLSYYPEDAAEATPAPGSRSAFFAGEISLQDEVELCRPLDMPALMERKARLELMDEQGVEAIIQLPSIGVLFEPDIDDIPALFANIRSFNRWIEEAWGYGDDGRIFAVPILSLADRELAVQELERVADQGGRGFYVTLGPVGERSPADPYFDPFWARVEERELLTFLHVGANGYTNWFGSRWSEPANPKVRHYSAFLHYSCLIDRPTSDTIAAFITHNLFGRFPGLRVGTIELGSAWVQPLLSQLEKAVKMAQHSRWLGGALTDTPTEIFRRHVWVSPFHEEDVAALVELIGADHVLAGSDFPHGEGLASPRDFARALEELPADDVRRIMRSNAAGLLGLAP